MINYRPGSEENKLWDDIAGEMEYPSHFKNIVFSLTADMESPRKEYLRLMCIAGESANVNKYSRPWLYEICDILKDSDKISVSEHNRVDGILLGAYFMDYRYAEAVESEQKESIKNATKRNTTKRKTSSFNSYASSVRSVYSSSGYGNGCDRGSSSYSSGIRGC